MNASNVFRSLGIIAFLATFLSPNIQAQTKRSGSIRYYHQQNKGYALYFPSGYRRGKIYSVVVAFHPLNSHRWHAVSWRDQLIDFAERNQVILICPDGGLDGKTDDKIDLHFSRYLLQQAIKSYSLRVDNVYTMGYSWGARAALKMALTYGEIINGCLLVGINASSVSIPESLLIQARGLACYFIHGEQDHVQSNLLPLAYTLDNYGACTARAVVKKTGHTFFFSNRKAYLDKGLYWLSRQSCYHMVRARNSGESLRFRPEFQIENKRVRITYDRTIYPIQQIRIYNKD